MKNVSSSLRRCVVSSIRTHLVEFPISASDVTAVLSENNKDGRFFDLFVESIVTGCSILYAPKVVRDYHTKQGTDCVLSDAVDLAIKDNGLRKLFRIQLRRMLKADAGSLMDFVIRFNGERKARVLSRYTELVKYLKEKENEDAC